MKSIELPDYDSKDAVFLLFLLKGYTLWIDNLPELTGFQDAPQRAFRLRAMGLPIRDIKRAVKPRYCKPVAFYYLDGGEVNALFDAPIISRFIDRVIKHWGNDENIKKGLRSKPQPLKSILAGKLEMERD